MVCQVYKYALLGLTCTFALLKAAGILFLSALLMSFANVILPQQLDFEKNEQLYQTAELWVSLFWFSLAGNIAVKLEPTRPKSSADFSTVCSCFSDQQH